MRFIIDAQLPPDLTKRLAQKGYVAEHVNRVGLGTTSDAAIWDYAVQVGAVLVTKDQDFAALARRQSVGPQVVWVRIGNISNDGLWDALGIVLDEIVEALQAGERIVEVT